MDAIEAAARAALAEAGVDAGRRRVGGVQPRRRGLAGGLRAAGARTARAARPAGAAARGQRRARRAARRARPTGPASRSSAAPTTRSAPAIPTGASSTSASGPTARAGRDLGGDALRRGHARGRSGSVPRRRSPSARSRSTRCADAIALLHAFTRRGGLGEDGAGPARAGRARRRGRGRRGRGRRSWPARAASSAGRRAPAPRRLGLPLAGTRIVLTGGVFAHPTERLADATMAELPGAVAVRHRPPPIAGALLLALDRLGVRADAAPWPPGCRSRPDGRSARWAGSPSRA